MNQAGHDMICVKMWHSRTIQEAFDKLGSGPKGLTSEEAQARLAKFGPNALTRENRPSALSMFLGQFKNTLIIILLAATALSLMVGEKPTP